MEVLTNIEISKVYEGPSGTSQHGPWQIYNFYVKDHKEKFSVFGKDDLIPVPDLKLKLLKYEIKHSEKDGKSYTNYNVKEIILEEGEASQPAQKQPQTTQKSLQRDNTLTMYVSYAKDILVQLLANVEQQTPTTLNKLCQEAVEAGKMMHDIAQEPLIAPEKPQEQEGKATASG